MTVTTWTTLITTADYAPGVICLAHSLILVRSRARLLCYVTTEQLRDFILTTAVTTGHKQSPTNLDIVVIPEYLYDDIFARDISRDHSQFIDAARRFLFRDGKPFIFLDSDMIVTQNIDELLDMANQDDAPEVIAVPNFRNKKKGYGDATGNFNAGMMIVTRPSLADYDNMIRILSAGYNDTEEKLLNEIFRNRWTALPIGYNCQKRAFKLAPRVWNGIQASTVGIKILHYVGGKPWQSVEDIRRLDWEGGCDESMAPYEPLFGLWRSLYAGQFTTPEHLLGSIPVAPEPCA